MNKNSQMERFSRCTEVALRAAGWFPGRSVLTESQLPASFQIFPAAEVVLDEFGGLRIGTDGPGIDMAKLVFRIDAMKAAFENERFDEFVPAIQSRLYPLGEIDGENLYLTIDEKGQVFLLMDDLWFIAPHFDEAIERMLCGRKALLVDKHGAW